MKILYFIAVTILLVGQIYAFTDEEILDALQKKAELLDPDSARYLTDDDKKYIADFLKQNELLFASLGAKETQYYIKLIELNRNPNINQNFAQYAAESYKKYFDKYTANEQNEIVGYFSKFYEKHFISQEELGELQKLKLPAENEKK